MAVRKLEEDYEAHSTAAGSSTRSVHDGTARRKPMNALTTPIFQTATYTFANTQELVDFMQAKTWGDGVEQEEYGRYGNPTVRAVEQRLAALDGGEDAVLYASGMNAVTSVLLSSLPSGTHIVMTDDCYRRSRQFCMTFLRRLNIETS
jgi:cystathionine gamma-synthase